MKKLICKLAQAYLDQLCVPWRHQKLQCRASVDSRVLSSSVASQRLTLSKMVSDHELYKNLWTSPPITVPRMRTHVSHAYSQERIKLYEYMYMYIHVFYLCALGIAS